MLYATPRSKPPGSVIPRGSKWIARWSVKDQDGRHGHSRTFSSESAAWRFLRSLELDRQNALSRAEQHIRARSAFVKLAEFPDKANLVGPFDEDLTYVLAPLPCLLRQALAPYNDADDDGPARLFELFEATCAMLVEMVKVNIAAKEVAAGAISAIEHGVAEGLDKLAATSLRSALSNPQGLFVYCLWGDDHRTPLYVGKSTNVVGRLGFHFSTREKAALIRRVTLVRCPDTQRMDETEWRLIRRHRPAWNTMGIGRIEEEL